MNQQRGPVYLLLKQQKVNIEWIKLKEIKINSAEYDKRNHLWKLDESLWVMQSPLAIMKVV